MGDRATAVGDSESGRGKGKDKAVADKPADDLSMGEEEESSSDESVAEDVTADEEEDDVQNDLEPISTSNIISGGRRTRGKTIDFAEAARKAHEAGVQIDEDDDDDDDDFEAKDDETNGNDADDLMKD
ncbi:uncharacterized protein PADG_08116 [Paracoccidioides brasiliensis Pb18]|uniref:Histone chaperone domain-containing protein n=1 Tax=Paracoccidioides brasiliensis (strain Pb18) TaxID=502780 RepID=C1GLI0_PARBD|nr:uncharacterized protein PADG_08116 [Paracoccidioides brasiliensis Pb18]EEH43296.2 hypothetical protein PADG_08116 [Paracoccidioides brasiliensis Pb18]